MTIQTRSYDVRSTRRGAVLYLAAEYGVGRANAELATLPRVAGFYVLRTANTKREATSFAAKALAFIHNTEGRLRKPANDECVHVTKSCVKVYQ